MPPRASRTFAPLPASPRAAFPPFREQGRTRHRRGKGLGRTRRRGVRGRASITRRPIRWNACSATSDYRKQLLEGEIWEFTCFAGTTIQETHETHPDLRAACAGTIDNHLRMLECMIDTVLVKYPVTRLRAATLATHIQAVIQGAFIMAKARQDRKPALDSIDHLHRYLELLFAVQTSA
jgi:hypothetical protein